MSPILVLLVVFGVTLLIGLPITWSLALSSLCSLAASGNYPISFLASKLFGGTEKYTLLAIFFFILAGAIMQHGGISKRLVDFSKALVGHIDGSLSVVTIVVCMFFAAISGSSIATTAAVGSMLYPELVEAGYDKRYAASLPIIGGTLGIVIPPSIVFVVYGTTTNTSISKLLLSGLIPGVLAGVMMCVYAYFNAKRLHVDKSSTEFSWKRLGSATKEAVWALLMPIIILGGIYAGIFTPTEAAAFSAVYGLIISKFVYKQLTWKRLMDIIISSVKSTANILLLVMAALAFGWILTRNNVPAMFASFLGQYIHSQTTFLLASFVLLLFLGMLMDNGAIILIVAPLMYPIAMSYGIDPIHYGCLTVFNLAGGQATPPFGTCLFTGSSVMKVGVADIIKKMTPFLVVLFAAVLMTTLIPEISTWLPNLMKK